MDKFFWGEETDGGVWSQDAEALAGKSLPQESGGTALWKERPEASKQKKLKG